MELSVHTVVQWNLSHSKKYTIEAAVLQVDIKVGHVEEEERREAENTNACITRKMLSLWAW